MRFFNFRVFNHHPKTSLLSPKSAVITFPNKKVLFFALTQGDFCWVKNDFFFGADANFNRREAALPCLIWKINLFKKFVAISSQDVNHVSPMNQTRATHFLVESKIDSLSLHLLIAGRLCTPSTRQKILHTRHHTPRSESHIINMSYIGPRWRGAPCCRRLPM